MRVLANSKIAYMWCCCCAIAITWFLQEVEGVETTTAAVETARCSKKFLQQGDCGNITCTPGKYLGSDCTCQECLLRPRSQHPVHRQRFKCQQLLQLCKDGGGRTTPTVDNCRSTFLGSRCAGQCASAQEYMDASCTCARCPSAEAAGASAAQRLRLKCLQKSGACQGTLTTPNNLISCGEVLPNRTAAAVQGSNNFSAWTLGMIISLIAALAVATPGIVIATVLLGARRQRKACGGANSDQLDSRRHSSAEAPDADSRRDLIA